MEETMHTMLYDDRLWHFRIGENSFLLAKTNEFVEVEADDHHKVLFFVVVVIFVAFL